MRAFNDVPISDFKNNWHVKILKEIKSKGKDYILKVDEEEYHQYLYSIYLLFPIEILKDTEVVIPVKTREWYEDRVWQQRYERDIYRCTVTYNYTGSSVLFTIRPNPFIMVSFDIALNEAKETVSFSFDIHHQDPELFKKIKDESFKAAFTNLVTVNENIREINNSLSDTIKSCIQSEKHKYQNENNFFTAINAKINENTQSIFTPPTISKKKILQPGIANDKEFSSEPTLAKKMYEEIIKVIYDSGKSMERKPVLYRSKHEEGLRDQFLFILETRYIGITATGETFNSLGKTDILVKYAADGSILFIAECKFWHGAAEYSTAISQLFDRYLTWRESKVAVIMFVTNKDFSNVLKVIKNQTIKHKYYSRSIGERGESSFSYEFHLPQDKNKTVLVEVIAFHFDKK